MHLLYLLYGTRMEYATDYEACCDRQLCWLDSVRGEKKELKQLRKLSMECD